MRLLGVMTSEQRLTVRTKLTKVSILGAYFGSPWVTVRRDPWVFPPEGAEQRIFCLEDFFALFPIMWMKLASSALASGPCSLATPGVSPASPSGCTVPLGAHLKGGSFRAAKGRQVLGT